MILKVKDAKYIEGYKKSMGAFQQFSCSFFRIVGIAVTVWIGGCARLPHLSNLKSNQSREATLGNQLIQQSRDVYRNVRTHQFTMTQRSWWYDGTGLRTTKIKIDKGNGKLRMSTNHKMFVKRKNYLKNHKDTKDTIELYDDGQYIYQPLTIHTYAKRPHKGDSLFVYFENYPLDILQGNSFDYVGEKIVNKQHVDILQKKMPKSNTWEEDVLYIFLNKRTHHFIGMEEIKRDTLSPKITKITTHIETTLLTDEVLNESISKSIFHFDPAHRTNVTAPIK